MQIKVIRQSAAIVTKYWM